MSYFYNKQSRISETLRTSAARYRGFIENLQGIAYQAELGGDWVPIFFHGAVEAITGYREEDFQMGTPRWDQIINRDDLSRVYQEGEKLLSIPNYSIVREYRIRHKDGQIRWIREIANNILEKDEPKIVQGILYDITRHKQLENQNIKTRQMATIGETAGMVGHDLRNPLQAIVNTVYLANKKLESLPSESAEKDDLKRYLDTVEKQVSYMNKIVSDLLDYARPIHLEPIETNLRQLINNTFSTMEIPETVEVSTVVPKSYKLNVDPAFIRRVFTNLFTNAVQAMPEGGKLTIKASKKAEELFISVKDTGVGIRKEDLFKLFQPLFTTKSKGQGFGLPVCKRIIDAHGGEIIVKSKVGKGSTFTVKIPLLETLHS